MNEDTDREAWKSRTHGEHYGMGGRPETDWQSDVRRAFEGFTEALAAFAVKAEAHKLRKGEEDYLSYATAWECAAVEYAWRGHHQGMYDAYTTVAARVGEWMGRAHAAETEITREAKRNGELAGKVESLRRALARFTEADLPAGPDYVNDVVLPAVVRERDEARDEAKSLRAALKAAEESAGRHRARADRIKEANLRLCALRDADWAEEDADVVPTRSDTGLLITPRKGSEILYVSRPGAGKDMGRLVPEGTWWKAYVYQARGPEEFIGWYNNTDKAARAVDREYGR